MEITWTRFACAIGLLMVAMIGLGAAPSALAGEVAFRAQLKNLGFQKPHLDSGKNFEDTIELVLPGELFEPPRELDPIARDQADLNTPEAAVRSDFSAWKADDAEWIKANFAASEQAALVQFLADAEIRAGSKAGFATLDSVFLWGVVRYRDYALVLITYGQVDDRSRGMTAALVQEDGVWKRTNALSADETLDMVWSAFRVGEMVARSGTGLVSGEGLVAGEVGTAMEQRLSMVTLGVADLKRAIAFYEDVVGWKAAPGPPEIAFFDLGGLVFSLYPHADMAKDRNAASGGSGGTGYQGFALAHNARSKEEVDSIFSRLRERGATILKEPEEVFWGGYSGYFVDPDGHAWEVAYNPHWTIGDDGRVSMTKD
jgi:hypothetical protein